MKISKDKKYKTRNGKEFKLYEIYGDKIHGAYLDGTEWDCQSWSINGSFMSCKETVLDLIEVSPYADYAEFKIDDKVLVWDRKDYKCKRHFAGVNASGLPLAWKDGMTSFTTDDFTAWENCEKYND